MTRLGCGQLTSAKLETVLSYRRAAPVAYHARVQNHSCRKTLAHQKAVWADAAITKLRKKCVLMPNAVVRQLCTKEGNLFGCLTI